MTKHMRIFASVLSVLALTFSGCTKKQTSDYNLEISETLRLHVPSEPPSLDWHKSTDTTSNMIEVNLMDGLTDYDYNDPSLPTVPALASSWESSPDQKTFTFTIREGVQWTDGKVLTAQHFVDGWERLLNPATASEYAYFLFNVKNAKQYNEGKIKDFKQVGAKVNEAGQLVINLERPQSFFPSTLGHHSTYPVRKDIVEKHGDKWTDPGNIVTLGAYRLTRWDHDKAVVLERSETYWGEKAKTKYILGMIVSETSTALNMFQTEKLDAMIEVPSLEVAKLKGTSEFSSHQLNGIYYLGFNVNKKPLDNKLVRRALTMAIDRKEITNLLGGGQIPITGWLPAGMMGYSEDVGLKFNPEEAKKVFAEAGYADASKFPTLYFGFNTNENHQRIAENVQAQLKRNLGISVELKNEEWKVYLSTLRVDAYPIFRMGWIADYADPDNFLGLMLSYSENNRGRWKNKQFDSLVEKAVTIASRDERAKLYLEAQKLMLEEDAAAVPVYSYVSQQMVAKRVKGFPANAMNQYKLKNVELQ
jgi:oligopeptide transport system substrate-binding protein